MQKLLKQLSRLPLYIFIFISAGTNAAPFIPQSDSVVLEQLPFKASDPTTRELRQLRAELSTNPHKLDKATRLAQRYYELAMADGDPRFIGYAQAALTPWWEMTEAPVPVLVLRATLRQYSHHFSSAIKDLNLATRLEPGNGAAWSLLAAIHMVQAEYTKARQNCDQLRGLASSLIAVACHAAVDSLNGEAGKAYVTLQKAYTAYPAAPANEKLWVLTRLAEIGDRLGKSAEADAYFKAALKLKITDAYLLAVYAEFLHDENRHNEVLVLLKDKERSDVLLMRLALAEKALKTPRAAELEAVIKVRFDAARLRGDKLHIQDEARFYLFFLANHPLPNPPPEGEGTNESLRKFYLNESLRLAQENWQDQHEPSDARMLLEAALAAKDKIAAQPALDWYQQSRIEDRHLQRLVKSIQALKP